MNTEIIKQPEQPRAALPAVATPADVLVYAMNHGADLAQIEKLMELQMRWDADQARKAYVADMAEFKKNPPQITKDKQVGYKDREGNFVGYTHATLGNVTSTIVDSLARHGFSHRWDTKQEGAQIIVSCILTHKLGHSETTTLQSAKDDSGKKNGIQAMASAITYLQRYTLLAATGLATSDQDDDGRAAELDVTLADKWIAKAKEARTVEALAKVWEDGCDEISTRGEQHAYVEFKAAVTARKAELNGTANEAKAGSRIAGIVQKAKQEAAAQNHSQQVAE